MQVVLRFGFAGCFLALTKLDAPCRSNRADPNAMEFAPDGRLFVLERINGKVRVG
jgi:hypothetical protein